MSTATPEIRFGKVELYRLERAEDALVTKADRDDVEQLKHDMVLKADKDDVLDLKDTVKEMGARFERLFTLGVTVLGGGIFAVFAAIVGHIRFT